MASIRVRVGRARGYRDDMAKIEAATVKAIAEETLKRAKRRVDHPAMDTLVAKGVNQHTAEIVGTRGGPGIILPQRKKALWWTGAAHPVSHVMGVGFGPLLHAEAQRIIDLDIDLIT
jgi:hypothetical protein